MGPVSRLCPEVHPRTAGQNRTHSYTPDSVPTDVPGQPHLGASARDTEGTTGRSVPLKRKRARRENPPGPSCVRGVS